MRKLLIAVILAAGFLFAVSCEGNKRCPAYQSADTPEVPGIQLY